MRHDLTIRALIAKQTELLAPGAAALQGLRQRPLSYASLLDRIDGIAGHLTSLGIGRGDRIAIVLPNGPEMAVAFLGVASVAVAAPLNPAYRAPEFDFFFADLEAKALLVVDGSDSPAVAVAESRGVPVIALGADSQADAGAIRLLPDIAASGRPAEFAQGGDVALILHTSGTTSRPKMVPLTHANLLASATHIRDSLKLTPEDCCLNVMPLFHIHGLVAALLSSLAGGGSVICTPGFVATEFFDVLTQTRPTWYTAVPTMHQAILARSVLEADRVQAAPLRFIRSSSSPLPAQVGEGLEKAFGVPVIEAYGMTEAAHQMCSNPLPPLARRFGSVGLPAGPRVAIMNEKGELAPFGESGEIVIQGPNVTSGYLANSAANAAAFTDGWFHTGDIGRFDAEGYLYLSARMKEIINRGGEKIAPREVDEVLLNHPAVAEALTFAMPDPRLGEEVAAAVVLRPGAEASEKDLMEFTAGRLAEFKVPRRIIILDALPKGPTGKPQRNGLAKKLGLEERSAGVPRLRKELSTPAESALAGIWREVLRIEDIGANDNFFELGGDSVLAAQVLARVQRHMGKQVAMLVFFQSPVLSTMAAAIEEAAGTAPDRAAAELEEMLLDEMDPEELDRLLAEVEVVNDEEALRQLNSASETAALPEKAADRPD